MTHDERLREVWKLHDVVRLSIPQIASRLHIGERDVHACIVEVWGMSASEKLAAGIKPLWREEDE